jgi:hypothetical protein
MKTLLPMVLAAVLCTGCETVVFEASPVAAQECDPALVGNWLSIGDKPQDKGEVEIRITSDCKLLFVEHEKEVTREGDWTQLYVGRDGRIRYLWIDARWTEQRMALTDERAKANAEEAKASEFAAGDFVVFQYRVDAHRLEVNKPNPKAFAHRIIDEQIKGEVKHDADGDLAVRVTAPVDPRQLRDAKLFPRGDMRFERAPADG